MFCETLPFILDYVSAVDATLRTRLPDNALSRIQRQWLCFCLTGMLLTNKFRLPDLGWVWE